MSKRILTALAALAIALASIGCSKESILAPSQTHPDDPTQNPPLPGDGKLHFRGSLSSQSDLRTVNGIAPLYLGGSINKNWSSANYDTMDQIGNVFEDGTTEMHYDRIVNGEGEKYTMRCAVQYGQERYLWIEGLKVQNVPITALNADKWAIYRVFRVVGDSSNVMQVDPIRDDNWKLKDVKITMTGFAYNDPDSSFLNSPIDDNTALYFLGTWSMHQKQYIFPDGDPTVRHKDIKMVAGCDALIRIESTNGPFLPGVTLTGPVNTIDLINIERDNGGYIRFIVHMDEDGTLRNPYPDRDDRKPYIHVG